MELWIRSQDKEILLNANTFIVQYTINAISEQYWNIFSNGYNLGKYSTEEKALSVLNKIENFIYAKDFFEKGCRNLVLQPFFEVHSGLSC